MGDAKTSEVDCEVVDTEVEVVSTITALLDVVGTPGVGTVDRTTGVIGLNAAGEAT